MRAKLFVILQHLIPHHFLSRIMHKLTRSKTNWWKNTFIKNFKKLYKIDMQDYGSLTENDFDSINAFFTRELIPNARVINNTSVLVSPVDGTVSQFAPIQQGQLIQAKNINYSVRRLLKESKWAEDYNKGSFCTIYLAPFNYHRIHMPCDGKLIRSKYIPGRLFSVNLTTAANVSGLFTKNERLICEFETQHGKLLMVLVGALFVGSMQTVWAGEITPTTFTRGDKQAFDQNHSEENILIERGKEMGRFNMGSTVVLLSNNPNMNFTHALGSIQLGQALAELNAE